MATTGGLFGNASTQPNTGGTSLFGASTTPAPSTPAGGLFGATPLKPAPSGLFGGGGHTTTASALQPGQTAAPPAQAASGGLFGSAQAQQKPAGGLFGGAQPATTTTTNTTAGSSLFGGAAATQQPSQPAAGGLFGASTANAQQTAAATGAGTATSAFGQAQTKPASNLFGQSQQQQQQQQPQQQQNQTTNQVIPAVQINYENLRPRSRFDDLAQPIQDEVALIDKGIQRVIKMRDEIGEFVPRHEQDIEQLANDVKFVESKFCTVRDALHRDIQTVKALQDATKRNIADAQLSFKATDNLKLPSHYHQPGLFAGSTSSASPRSGEAGAGAGTGAAAAADAAASAHYSNAQDLITYFNRICDDLERYRKRLDEYRAEIERDMPGVEHGLYEQIRSFRDRSAAASAAAAAGGNGGGNGGAVAQDQLNQVLSALRETGNAIIAQAGQIADTRERLSRLQAGFLDGGPLAH